MKLMIENEIVNEKPVILKLLRSGDGIINLMANGIYLLSIKSTGIYCYTDVSKSLGFDLDCLGRIVNLTKRE